MIAVPLLADFGVRLAFGLILALAFTPWRTVPPRYFRIQNLISLGILVLAALAQANASGRSLGLWLIVAAALSSYLAAVSWGLGLPPVAIVLNLIGAAAAAGWMAAASRADNPSDWLLMFLTRATSALLLGATMSSMLLGHYYLVAPSMTIEPLKRSLGVVASAMAARCLLAVIGSWTSPAFPSQGIWGGQASDMTLMAMRWGIGFVGAGVSVYLAWRTAAIRSTQSATGILYITTIFVLFGELAALLITGRGVIC